MPTVAMPAAPRTARRARPTVVAVNVALVVLAFVSTLIIAWSLEARRSLAVARAFGATPGQVRAARSVAQLPVVLHTPRPVAPVLRDRPGAQDQPPSALSTSADTVERCAGLSSHRKRRPNSTTTPKPACTSTRARRESRSGRTARRCCSHTAM